MTKKFRFLRIVSALYKLMAVLSFLGGIGVAVVGGLLQMNNTAVTDTITGLSATGVGPGLGIPVIVGGIVGGIFSMIILWATAQFFDVLIAMEENTRMTASLLNRLNRNIQDRGL
jgi:hypothetical protein